jgi:hypothetical protein
MKKRKGGKEEEELKKSLYPVVYKKRSRRI